MKKRGVKFLVLYTLACQLQNQADFLFRYIGEERPVPQLRASKAGALAGPEEAAQEPDSSALEGPPAGWRAKQEIAGPPDHWLKRVQGAAPELLAGRGQTPVRRVPPPLTPPTDGEWTEADRVGGEWTEADYASGQWRRSLPPSLHAGGPEASLDLPVSLNRSALRAVPASLPRIYPHVETELTSVLEKGESADSRWMEADRADGQRTETNEVDGRWIEADRAGEQWKREQAPILHAGGPEASSGFPASFGGAARRAAPASLPRVYPHVETELASVLEKREGVGDGRVGEVPSPISVQQVRPALLTRKERASSEAKQDAFIQPAEEARESVLKPDARRRVVEARESESNPRGVSLPAVDSLTPQAASEKWPALPARSDLSGGETRPGIHSMQSVGQGLWPALSISTVHHLPGQPGAQSQVEICWPSLPTETIKSEQGQILTRQSWERQQRLDNEQRGSVWNV